MNDRVANLLSSLKDALQQKGALASYENCYLTLRDWILTHREWLRPEYDQQLPQLRAVLELDFERYLVPDPGIVLAAEPNRLMSVGFHSVDTLLRGVSLVMWEMVTIVSDEECVSCTADDVRYLMYEGPPGGSHELIRKCGVCGFAERVAGPELNLSVGIMRPASQTEIDSMIVGRGP